MKKLLFALPLLSGCMTSFIVSNSALDGEPAPPMSGSLFDLCVTMGAFEKGEVYLRVWAFLDLFPSLGLDLALLPITVPAWLIWG